MDALLCFIAAAMGAILGIFFVIKVLATGLNPQKLEQKIQNIPQKVLESITGSISNNKGKLAELVAYINLKASYDRIIPLSNIVDFIVIKFCTEDSPGKLIFVDIKNGKSARLSEDQKSLKRIIETGNIEFLKLNINTDSVLDINAEPESGPDKSI